MLNVSGLIVIPQEPSTLITRAGNGSFISFKAVTESSSKDKEVKHNYWNCSVFIPAEEADHWAEVYLAPGTVLYVQHAAAISLQSPDGKYLNTKIQIDRFKIKKLEVPFWFKE